MPIAFSSNYEPINLLNSAIQNQAARQQQGYLQASALNDASVADSLNRIVQQKALEQQSRDRQAHYGLQQQQLANDLAYRNAALKEAELRSIEQARQFDAQFGLNKKIAEAQLNNPFYGQKDAVAFGLQAGMDADKFNQEAEGAASELNRKKAALDAQHKTVTDRIKGDTHFWGSFVPGIKSGTDLLREADDAYSAALMALKQNVPGGEKTRFDPIKNEFQALRMTPPQFGRQQPIEASGEEAPNAGAANIGAAEGPGQGTGEGVISQPFTRFGGAPEIRPDAAVAPVATVNPFTAFLQRQLYGNSSPIRTNAPPAVVTAPAVTNRVFRFDPQRGLVPIQ